MSFGRGLIVAGAITLGVLLAGCEKKATEEVDFGSITNSVYRNQYFGLTVPIPPNWSVQDQEAQRRLQQVGINAIAGEGNLKRLLKASELQTINLFGAFKHPLGTPGDFNASVMGAAEKVRQLPGIKRGSDYLANAKKVLQAGQLEVSFPNDFYTRKIGNLDFDVLDAEMLVGKLRVKQKYCSTIRKGYALNLIISYMSDEDLELLQKILDGVTFN